MSNPTTTTPQLQPPPPTSTAKRQKHRHHHHPEENHDPLLPGLPDHIAQLCLSLVPPSTLSAVCRSWRRLIYSPSFPPFLSLYSLSLSPLTQNQIHFSSFDPISHKWETLPPPAAPPQFLLRHPSFISRNIPIQTAAVAGKLVVLAATADQFLPALSSPLIFDPSTRNWSHGPELSAPRRWCAAGVSREVVYLASGIGSHYSTDVARSVEKWDLRNGNGPWNWENLGQLKDGRFCREAIEAVGWQGKLCMVNVKGDAAKEGAIYDVGNDTWEEMPEGMLAGWRGPAAAMGEETIYVVDETRGSLRKYDHVRDAWVEVVGNCAVLKGARQVVAAEGKVCVLCGDGFSIAVVDVAEGRVWVVDSPPGLEAVAIHVLPRLSTD